MHHIGSKQSVLFPCILNMYFCCACCRWLGFSIVRFWRLSSDVKLVISSVAAVVTVLMLAKVPLADTQLPLHESIPSRHVQFLGSHDTNTDSEEVYAISDHTDELLGAEMTDDGEAVDKETSTEAEQLENAMADGQSNDDPAEDAASKQQV